MIPFVLVCVAGLAFGAYALSKTASLQRQAVAATKRGDVGTMKSFAARFTAQGGRLALESTAAAMALNPPSESEALEGLAAALAMTGAASAAWADAFISEGRFDLGQALARQAVMK